jgi:hypothetical protein
MSETITTSIEESKNPSEITKEMIFRALTTYCVDKGEFEKCREFVRTYLPPNEPNEETNSKIVIIDNEEYIIKSYEEFNEENPFFILILNKLNKIDKNLNEQSENVFYLKKFFYRKKQCLSDNPDSVVYDINNKKIPISVKPGKETTDSDNKSSSLQFTTFPINNGGKRKSLKKRKTIKKRKTRRKRTLSKK